MFPVTLHVPVQLGKPIFLIGLGPSRDLAGRAAMLMPVASVHEDDLLPGSKHEVGFSRQIFPVQAVAVSHPVHGPAHEEFRLRALAAYRPHVGATPIWWDPIRHCKLSHGEIKREVRDVPQRTAIDHDPQQQFRGGGITQTAHRSLQLPQ